MASVARARLGSDDRKLTLSIYLLQTDQAEEFEDMLVDEARELISLVPPLNGIFVPLEPVAREPLWVSALATIIETPLDGEMMSSAPSGLLVVWRSARTFVLPFGPGAWQKLRSEWLEHDFGRRVALNAVPRNAVVWLKSEQFLAKWHLASERAPRASFIDEFAVDFERDLVAAVEGVPTLKPSLGERVRGGTSLHLTIPMSNLGDVLDECFALFKSDSYKTDWPDIDNIRRIDDDTAIARLNTILDSTMSTNKASNLISMFTPFQKKGEPVIATAYVFGTKHAGAYRTPYLTFEGWTNHLARRHLKPSVAEAKHSTVHVLDENYEAVCDFQAFDCFGYEADLDGRVCILSSGEWYEVLGDFVTRINGVISRIPRGDADLPRWNHQDDEDSYNAICAFDPLFLNCDRKIFRFGGSDANYQFEFCDLINIETRTLFFVKKGSKSSGMSHLFEQVRRTVEPLFGVDSAYRVKVAEVLERHHAGADVTWLRSRPRQGDWKLCLVSLGEPANSLPFFSRCALVKLFEELDRQGHSVFFMDV